MSSPNFNVDRLQFEVREADAVQLGEWTHLQRLGCIAFADSLKDKREEYEVAHMMSIHDHRAFAEGHIDPQNDVKRGRLNPGLFKKPLVVTAYDGFEPVAYATSYDNTSGETYLERKAKMVIPPGLPVPKIGGKRYHWFREVVVHPNWQHRGLAHVVSYLLLERRNRQQTVTAYTWEELPGVALMLQAAGLRITDTSEPKEVFGPSSRKTRLLRLAGNAGRLMDHIIELPGAAQAISQAHNSMQRLRFKNP